MGFWRANHGLSKHGILKTKIWSHFEKDKNVKRRRRREEEEEDGGAKANKVWNFGFLVWKLNLCMDLWNFKGFIWLIACLQI